MPHNDDVVIAVCGGGIAGLSFAIAAKRQTGGGAKNKKVRVVVLERGAEGDGERRTQYSHSISLRTQVGGIQALHSLGIFEEMSKKVTPSLGGYIGRIPYPGAQPNLALHASWFGTKGSIYSGLRIFRFDLWHTLRETALSLGVEIRYDSQVVGVEEIVRPVAGDIDDDGDDDEKEMRRRRLRVVMKSSPSPTSVSFAALEADLVVAADGARSAIRTALQPNEKLNFLNTLICGCTDVALVGTTLPKFCQNHHGMLCAPNGTSVFISDDGDNHFSFGVGMPATEPVARDALAKDENLRERLRETAKLFPPPYSTLTTRLLDTEKEHSFSLSCYDKMPNPPAMGGRVVFIGDACHPVSPYGASGGNMALADGVALANALFGGGGGECDSGNGNGGGVGGGVDARLLSDRVLHTYYPKRAKQVTKIVNRQRFVVGIAHTSSWRARVLRNLVFDVLPYIAEPKKRWVVVFLLVAAAVAFVAWLMRWV